MKKKHPTPVIRLTTPQDLLQAIPHLLGFHPSDCLVAVLAAEGRIDVTARLDLEALETADGPGWLAERLTLDEIGRPRSGTQIFLVGYGRRARAGAAVRAMRELLADQVIETLVVEAGTWWFLDDPADLAGLALDQPSAVDWADLIDRPVAASRAALADAIAAPRGDREDKLLDSFVQVLERIPDSFDEAGQLALKLMADWQCGTQLSAEDYLLAGALMSAARARDAVWRVLDHDWAVEHLPFWIGVLTHTPGSLRAVPLAVTGIIAWLAQEASLMNICLEEALALDSRHELVDLLRQICLGGFPPSYWEQVNRNY